ncbi:hypothetical protein [Pseudorhodobacter sp. MZDSW-24AT]|uniref:hypothetical protein n=1 Tax=Pseudorhodobacter sp. MZDSW-24AT TaxID=2052957 RepID=UPI0012FDD629|nr:hypothetical protein [Pseudorhodobacter sp. MZDSW-24AT]
MILPTDWGNDALTQYLDAHRFNQLATFANKKSQLNDLIEIDSMFRKLLDGAINPKPFLPFGFIFRAHSAYLSACSSVMGGQLYEAQSLLRVALEQAGYGHYIGSDEARWKRWMAREEPRSRSQKDKWREEFTHGKVAKAITAADGSVGEIYNQLYERSISYGAHPNQLGDSMGSAIEDLEDGGKHFLTIYLHGNGIALDFAIKSTSQVGLCVLRIAKIIYPFRMQATGLDLELDAICQRF